LPIHERVRAGTLFDSVREIIDERVAAALASRGRTGQVIIRIEPGIGFAALGCAMQQVVREGMHARRANIGIAARVKRGVKVPPSLEEPLVRGFEAPHVCHYRAGGTATRGFVMGPVKIRLTEDRSLTTPVAADMIDMVVRDVVAAQAWYAKHFGVKPVKRVGVASVNRAKQMDLAVCTLTDPWGTFIEISQGFAAVR
jgi:hypothetical protein